MALAVDAPAWETSVLSGAAAPSTDSSHVEAAAAEGSEAPRCSAPRGGGALAGQHWRTHWRARRSNPHVQPTQRSSSNPRVAGSNPARRVALRTPVQLGPFAAPLGVGGKTARDRSSVASTGAQLARLRVTVGSLALAGRDYPLAHDASKVLRQEAGG
jgi:hypothetical protein